jgi:transposase-like protein
MRPIASPVHHRRQLAADRKGAALPEVREITYTTNAIEGMHARSRKSIMSFGLFPSDETATKLIWWALRNITRQRSRAALKSKAAMN